MTRSILHVAPHSHPYKESFTGRFGGQSVLMRRLLEDQPGGCDHHQLTFGSGRYDHTCERLHQVVPTSKSLPDALNQDAATLASHAQKIVEQLPAPVTVCFHYWDGAAVFRHFKGLDTVRTTFITHSLQLAHQMLGRQPPEAIEARIALERDALEQADLAMVMSGYEAGLIADAGYNVNHLSIASKMRPLSPVTFIPAAGRPVRILFGGRRDSRKNLEGLAKILENLAHGGAFGARMGRAVISGPGDLIQGFSSTASVRNLNFVPHDEFLDEINNADIVIVPSFYEPFGLIILEGLLSGAHVVAPRLSAAGDWQNEDLLTLADFGNDREAERAVRDAIAKFRQKGRAKRRGEPREASHMLAGQITSEILRAGDSNC